MVVVLCGKSGSGKDTIREQLLKQMDFYPVVSVTSRPMRKGEVQGKEYDFISQEAFLQEIEAGKFLEYRSYQTAVNGISETWYYGTRKESLETDKDVIAIKDPHGAKEIQNYCSQKEIPCLIYYLDVPDAIRTMRAKKRPGYDKTEWNRRLKADNRAFSAENLSTLNAIAVANDESPKEAAVMIATGIQFQKKMSALLADVCQAVFDLEQTPEDWRRAVFSLADPRDILYEVPLQMVRTKLDMWNMRTNTEEREEDSHELC